MKPITQTKSFPNSDAIKRPDYLPPLKTRQERIDWDNEVLTRYMMLTQDLTVDGKIKVSPYNKAKNGCNRKSIPTHDWDNIVDHCLWVAAYTYDRNKAANIERYNREILIWNQENPDQKPRKLRKVPKSVCPLPNYFWKLLYFTSCTWYKKFSDSITNTSLDHTT